MEFKQFVENDLVHIRVVKISSSCKIDSGEIEIDKLLEEEELSVVGIDTIYFECAICGIDIIDDDNLDKRVEEHWEEFHKGE